MRSKEGSYEVRYRLLEFRTPSCRKADALELLARHCNGLLIATIEDLYAPDSEGPWSLIGVVRVRTQLTVADSVEARTRVLRDRPVREEGLKVLFGEVVFSMRASFENDV